MPGEREQRYDIAHTFASGTGGQKFIIYRGVDMVVAIRNGAGSAADGGTVVDQFSGHKTVWNAVRPAMLPFDPLYKDDEAGFCAAYRRSEYAPDLREPWFKDTGAPPATAAPSRGRGAGAPTAPLGLPAPARVRGTAASALPAAAGAALGGGLRQRQARARGARQAAPPAGRPAEAAEGRGPRGGRRADEEGAHGRAVAALPEVRAMTVRRAWLVKIKAVRKGRRGDAPLPPHLPPVRQEVDELTADEVTVATASASASRRAAVAGGSGGSP